MRKIIVCLLVIGIIFSLVACSSQQDFSQFQGTWVRRVSSINDTIRIQGSQVYEQLSSPAAGTSPERTHGLGLYKENGVYYVLYGDTKKEISVSSDGTELYFEGKTYYKD